MMMIETMSQEQKNLRLLLSSCHDTERIKEIKNERNQILKEIQKKTKANREKEIDEKVKYIDNLRDESKMFKAVKMLNRSKFENPFVHDRW